MLLKDRVAIVTGGGRGIGKAICQLYANEGASVVVAARSEAEIGSVSRGIEDAGGRALPVKADITDLDDIKAMVSKTMEEYGRIDILINNAGYAPPQQMVVDFDDDEWRMALEVNLHGPYLCTKEVLPGMIERGYGTIINLSSGLGKIGIAGYSAYCSAKHAIIGFTKTLAAEVGQNGITVNVICPGPTETEMIRNADKQFVEDRIKSMVIRRLVQPEEVAGMALYLASDLARSTTGQAIGVNGGNVMH